MLSSSQLNQVTSGALKYGKLECQTTARLLFLASNRQSASLLDKNLGLIQKPLSNFY